jgi:hypothetical protein
MQRLWELFRSTTLIRRSAMLVNQLTPLPLFEDELNMFRVKDTREAEKLQLCSAMNSGVLTEALSLKDGTVKMRV